MATVAETLTPILARWPSVRAAWLFGSTAEGRAGPLSDIDIAVLGCVGLGFDDRAQLAAELSRAAGQTVDVVCAEQASPVMGMEIVRAGRRFFCQDAEAADRWEDFALRRYLDTADLRRIVFGHMREDLLRPGR